MQNKNSQNDRLTELTTKSIASNTYQLHQRIQKRNRKRRGRGRRRKKEIIRLLKFPLRLHKVGTGFKFNQNTVDFKNTTLLCQFLNKQGQIFARRRTGLNYKKQRHVAYQIKHARIMALFPFQFYGLPPKDDKKKSKNKKKYKRKYKRYNKR